MEIGNNTVHREFRRRVQRFLDRELVPVTEVSKWAVGAPSPLGRIMKLKQGFNDISHAAFLAAIDGIEAAEAGKDRTPPPEFPGGGHEAERFLFAYDEYLARERKAAARRRGPTGEGHG